MNTWITILMFLVRMVTSRTEPIDLQTLRDFHEKMLFPKESSRPISEAELSINPNNWIHGNSQFQSIVDDDLLKKLLTYEELDDNLFDNSATVEEDLIPRSLEEMDETEMKDLSARLTKLLQQPGPWEAPFIVIEEPVIWQENDDGNGNVGDDFTNLLPSPWKRSRYYRRYTGKRQNSRSRSYDYDASRYLCTPTKEDVFQLLVALHDARRGNKVKTVNFCNRRRPAGTVFTNIRFLGRKRK